ncbi:MAG: preprotein translocase subunit SecG [Planctomycetes bacterium]|jgi:preprotein translocase subunit SecG|nr:preprotein translocase subunit SecG [Planctomycetota bacterium]HON45036.1 preprotein translocase subunit SecG [Planctomycetota bacterium]HRU52741.1 preprotein translocase subunit SecG [Planctomycetota bacterium]
MDTLYNILQILLIISGIVMIVLIMFRKGEVGGLSGAFGGLGGDTAFGVKAQKQLDKIITIIAVFFIVVAILMSTPRFRQYGRAAGAETHQEAPAPAQE